MGFIAKGRSWGRYARQVLDRSCQKWHPRARDNKDCEKHPVLPFLPWTVLVGDSSSTHPSGHCLF